MGAGLALFGTRAIRHIKVGAILARCQRFCLARPSTYPVGLLSLIVLALLLLPSGAQAASPPEWAYVVNGQVQHGSDRALDNLVPLWLLAGLSITVVPLLVVGSVARVLLKMNFVVLSGLIAGSMTDPPALAFANTLMKSDAPSVSYAAVYPLTMLLRIRCAQFIVLLFV
jgi:Predicted Permease Membrane Region